MAFDIKDFTPHFFTHGGIERVKNLLREPNPKFIPAQNIRLGPPLPRPSKIICLGKNYAEHAAEFDAEIPSAPLLFSKATTSIIGPFDSIEFSTEQKNIDIEVELAVVIGQRAKNISSADAMNHVAGYTILNDVTDRQAQRESKQWFRGKSPDTFCPLGPFWITPDETPDPHNLRIYSKINDATLQEDNTSHMIFKIPDIIAYISQTITLEPGDLISTGTPAGVGFARTPPIYLKHGDLVETGIEHLGAQKTRVL